MEDSEPMEDGIDAGMIRRNFMIFRTKITYILMGSGQGASVVNEAYM